MLLALAAWRHPGGEILGVGLLRVVLAALLVAALVTMLALDLRKSWIRNKQQTEKNLAAYRQQQASESAT
jgi:hypothetical protein